MGEVFKVDVGFEFDLIDISEDGYVMVCVDDIIESCIKFFEEVWFEVKDVFIV